jgi:hypothetical protein
MTPYRMSVVFSHILITKFFNTYGYWKSNNSLGNVTKLAKSLLAEYVHKFLKILQILFKKMSSSILTALWGRDSSVGIAMATGWTVRGSNTGRGEIFRTRPDWPWGSPSLLYSGYRVFPGVKRSGRGADQPPPSSAEVKKE